MVLFGIFAAMVGGIGAGFVIGLLTADHIRKQIDKAYSNWQQPPPETGATPGLYHRANEGNVNQGGDTGLVVPKTPQLLEWEEQERLRQEQLGNR